MIWTVDDAGVWTAKAGGIHFELLPCEGAVFDLEHCMETAEHLARLQAAGQGWADGAVCRMAFRVEPPAREKKTPAPRRMTR